MATAPFAALEQRLNRACVARTANALAQFAGVTDPVPCQFDNTYAIGSAGPFGASTTQPSIACLTSVLPVNPVGTAVVVGGASYLVAQHLPDGTGISVLMLEVAA